MPSTHSDLSASPALAVWFRGFRPPRLWPCPGQHATPALRLRQRSQAGMDSISAFRSCLHLEMRCLKCVRHLSFLQGYWCCHFSASRVVECFTPTVLVIKSFFSGAYRMACLVLDAKKAWRRCLLRCRTPRPRLHSLASFRRDYCSCGDLYVSSHAFP